MIRHILFWKYTDTVKAEHKEAEALAFLQKAVATMVGHIDGLLCAEINTNTAGGEYDLVSEKEKPLCSRQRFTIAPAALKRGTTVSSASSSVLGGLVEMIVTGS